MKKFTAVLAALMTALCCLTSCSENNNSSLSEESSSTSERQKRVSSAKIDENILGTWRNDLQGYRFQEDRNVSLLMNFSDSVHFTKDGKLMLDGEILPDDMLTNDGLKITAKKHYDGFDEPADIFTLERKDGQKNTDTIDGTYKMTEGSYIKLVASNFGLTPEQANIEVVVDGENFDIILVDYCLYETNNGKLDLFSENMDYVDENANAVSYDYSIDGDTLTMTYETGDTEILKKTEDK